MRTVLIGAVESTSRALEALAEAGSPPRLLVTLRQESAARHSDYVDLEPLAREFGVDVVRVSNVNASETLAAIDAVAPDLSIVVGWSQICRAEFLVKARLGTIGFHPAPLPQMRGRAVVPWTILEGMRETGATLMWLDEGTDTGDILLQQKFAVPENATARDLYDRHLLALAEMLPEAVRLAGRGEAPRVTQDHSEATWCAKRTAEDGRIDWQAPAAHVLRLIRAVGDPYPGAFTEIDSIRLTIDAATLVDRPQRFIGLTGQVQHVAASGFVVRCGDGACIDVHAWRSPSGGPPKLHSILGRKS